MLNLWSNICYHKFVLFILAKQYVYGLERERLLSGLMSVRNIISILGTCARPFKNCAIYLDSFEPEGPSAALLTRDSEIIISPKTRVDPLNAKHDISSHQEPSSTPSNDWTKHLFRLLPLPYIGNYDEFANLPFVRHYMQSTDITSEYVCFAFVNELCWSNFLVKHLDKTGKARIHWMKQVSWISQVSGAEKKSEKPRDNGEQENRKNATSKRKGNKEEESVDIIIVPCPSELIPEGHIWIDEKSRRSLGIDESPWELVK